MQRHIKKGKEAQINFGKHIFFKTCNDEAAKLIELTGSSGMLEWIHGIVKILADLLFQFLGNENIAQNIASTIIWTFPVYTLMGIHFLFRKYFFPNIPIKIILKIFFYNLTKWFRGTNININGFYYAIYVSSSTAGEADTSPKLSLEGLFHKTPKRTTRSGTIAAECIYLSKKNRSTKVKGYVFRRAKQKNNEITENKYFKKLKGLRLAGLFSDSHHIFCGYWLDPFNPEEVTGTFMLKWIDDNIYIEPEKKKYLLVGVWDGFDKYKPLPLDDVNQNKEFSRVSGDWVFIRIGSNIKEFKSWCDNLNNVGDTSKNPEHFLNWTPK